MQAVDMEPNRRRTTSFVDPAQAAVAEQEEYEHPLTGAMHGMAVSEHKTVTATCGPLPDKKVNITYAAPAVIGNGSFGVVFKTRIIEDGVAGKIVALKKVLQDRRYKNRELEIMRQVKHCNVVELMYFFFTPGKKDEVYLNLLMEFLPTTLSAFADSYVKKQLQMPLSYIKLSTYQMFRALNYLHSRRICHRDIKPQNLLLNVKTGVLKLCDFGCAKQLVPEQPNVSYICSRYYRAPELCLGASIYSHAIDVWSGGCVLAELLLSRPIFQGNATHDQMEKIMKILGTPSREQIKEMNPGYKKSELKRHEGITYEKLLRGRSEPERPLVIALLKGVFEYVPRKRMTCLDVLAHELFDELRDPAYRMPNDQPVPPLYNFSDKELASQPHLRSKLIPAGADVAMAAE